MDLKNAKVLITGGSDGIGKGLAACLIATGCKVMITGRSAIKLKDAARELPGLLTYRSDMVTRMTEKDWPDTWSRFCPV